MPLPNRIGKFVSRNQHLEDVAVKFWCSWKSRGNKRSVKGSANQISFDAATSIGVNISIQGNRNKIKVGNGAYLKNVCVNIIGDDNTIDVGIGTFITPGSKVKIYASRCQLIIGNFTSIRNADFQIGEPDTQIIVGNDCLFAEDVVITNTDWHSVIDLSTGKRINPAQDIEIEEHVWLAARVTVLKGVTISKGSILGTGSVVTRSIPGNSLAVGIPAKVIKSNVSWNSEALQQ